MKLKRRKRKPEAVPEYRDPRDMLAIWRLSRTLFMHPPEDWSLVALVFYCAYQPVGGELQLTRTFLLQRMSEADQRFANAWDACVLPYEGFSAAHHVDVIRHYAEQQEEAITHMYDAIYVLGHKALDHRDSRTVELIRKALPAYWAHYVARWEAILDIMSLPYE